VIHALNSPAAVALGNVFSIIWTVWAIWAIRELRRRPRVS
jgi:hypothetical protein